MTKKMRACGSEDVLESLPHRKQGKPLLLGDKIDSMVQANIQRVHEQGGAVSTQIVNGVAQGIMSTLGKAIKAQRIWWTCRLK